MSEKPTAIILPSWNPNEPRFIVEDAHDGLADDRAFKNGKCVYNQRLGIVYTVGYIVDALNEFGDEIDKLKEENEQLRKKLECCEYEHFKKELDKIHEKVEKGDLSDFGTLTISDKGLEHWNGVLK